MPQCISVKNQAEALWRAGYSETIVPVYYDGRFTSSSSANQYRSPGAARYQLYSFVMP